MEEKEWKMKNNGMDRMPGEGIEGDKERTKGDKGGVN